MSKKIINGIWFYGLSGVGKSYASNLVFKAKKNSIIIDGDVVRKYISTDLLYSKKDRNIQIHRMLGISKICLESNLFPIVSSVWMSKKISKKCNELGIKLIFIKTDMKKIFSTHATYKNKKDVVGKDLSYEKIRSVEIVNTKDELFWKKLKKLI